MRRITRSRRGRTWLVAVCATLAAVWLAIPVIAQAQQAGEAGRGEGVDRLKSGKPEIAIVDMNAARGRQLFVQKGCVVCHSVNGVGGSTGPSLDAQEDSPQIDPFGFAARMWRGAEMMLAFQKLELGYQVLLSGPELADIAAFAHDRDEQKKLKESDIPPEIQRLMRLRRI